MKNLKIWRRSQNPILESECVYQIIVIGAGAGGLVVAIGAAKAGKKVLLIEKGEWGGDCTNFGCIPSKTLISLAKNAFEKDSAVFALEKVRKTVLKVRAHEEPEELKKMGVDTLTGIASFQDPHTLLVTEKEGKTQTVRGKNIVIAAGSHPYIPPIKGLDNTPYLTNETVFSLKEIPEKFAILGAGPIGCELAHAFSRLGSKVFLFKSKRGILPKEDPLASQVIGEVFTRENIVHMQKEIDSISYEGDKFFLGKEKFDKLLISTGRRPNLNTLELDKAKIRYTEKGIEVDGYGRTNQHHICAIGDIVGPPFFTHLAENHGRTILTTLLLPGPLKKKLDKQEIPRCTFTDPEVASFGMLEKEAIEKYGAKKISTYTVFMNDVDRAICTNRREGFVKIITKKWSSKILGACIVAPRAGEMLQELTLAKLYRIPLRKLSRLIHPYPTYSGAIRKCADLWLIQTILGKIKK